MIDFKDIPPANGTVDQDKFELFARDFLIAFGFVIIDGPSRGPDGGIDIKVKDTRRGFRNTEVFYLVSCKHYAHSNKSITPKIETEIIDRMGQHGCTGFIGFYSTLPSTSLVTKLKGLKANLKIDDYEFFDSSEIQSQILKIKGGEILFQSYFRSSFNKWKKNHDKKENHFENTVGQNPKLIQLTKEDLYEATLTANILMDFINIKNEFMDASWGNRYNILRKIYKYSDYNNLKISKEVADFVLDISGLTRGGMPPDIALTIDSLISYFFPHSDNNEEREQINSIAIIWVNAAFAIIYDSMIHLRNLAVAEWPFATLKFIYQYSKQYKANEVQKYLMKEYDELERTLKRPDRNDLGPALQMTKIFRKDLVEPGMQFPIMPDELYNRIQDDERKCRKSDK